MNMKFLTITKTNTIKKIILSILIAMLLLAKLTNISAYASTENTRNIKVTVDGKNSVTVKVIDISYDNNAYYSLRDMAVALNGTDKSYSLSVSNAEINIELKQSYTAIGGYENTPWAVESNDYLKGHRVLSGNIYINDQEVNYYTMIVETNGVNDAFMTLNDLCMILNMKSEVSKDGSVRLYTNKEIDINPAKLERDGYFEAVNAVVVGDATTGEIYYQYKADEPFPIASTTKLVSYTVLKDAIANGELTLDSPVTISKKAAALSRGEDGLVKMYEGQKSTVKELMYAMLLPSSNEAALANAENLCGSEEAFVKRMYDLADKLNLSSAVFYNSHGLPHYVKGQAASKVNNRLSANDMFKLSSYILNTYPETAEITSVQKYTLKDFSGTLIKNTNPILKNMPEVIGLKTGTTNRAGCCFVSALRVDKDGQKHDLVVVMYGAENGMERGRVSQTLSTYAKNAYLGKANKFSIEVTTESLEAMPVTAEGIVARVVNATR